MSLAMSLRVMPSAVDDRQRRRLGPGSIVAVLALVAAGLLQQTAPAAASTPGSWSDFDNDGWSDLAVGMPYANIQGTTESGAVIVLYGSATGLTSTGSQIWNAQTVLASGNDVEERARS